MKTFIIYARYSSDLQNPKSCEDQIQLCTEYVERQGGYVAQAFSDDAITGKTMKRQGIEKVLEVIQARPGVILLCEALDRISRDQSDILFFFKLLKFNDVELHTVQDGRLNKPGLTIKAYLSEAYTDDVAKKTKRGQVAAVKRGKVASGICYGYNVCKKYDEKGEPIRGLREINPDQSEVIKRIYKEYSEGLLLSEIVETLNKDGIPSPSGKLWKINTLLGNRQKLIGILNNPMYVGQIVFNKERHIRDPITGKRLKKLNPREEWVFKDMPSLRIIDPETEKKVRLRQDRLLVTKGNRTRTTNPLTQKLFCKCCGSSLNLQKKERYFCIQHTKHKNCKNKKSISLEKLMEEISIQLRKALKNNRHHNLYKVQKFISDQKQEITVEQNKYKVQLSNLYEFVAKGTLTPSIKKKIAEYEHRLAVIKSRSEKTLTPAGRATRPLEDYLKRGALLYKDIEFQKDFASLITEIRVDEFQNIFVNPNYEAILKWSISELSNP
ncbi:hypothetical protein MTBPR1_80174 [Candidatus Terasakiella magnetica]|uniref:Recombinase n=1 Tax=Candidatus Terasakiella magnetica TaxID=1867952 RepID=A0A1C3RLC9_9PROT|nr:recombinase family protein [Candidatus Terasakiella magnetica]SCA58120.1 hypothetical protein MTBPR1_80174 [Candidatus Terasakiella magnetica]